jgi:hypothetical protein
LQDNSNELGIEAKQWQYSKLLIDDGGQKHRRRSSEKLRGTREMSKRIYKDRRL